MANEHGLFFDSVGGDRVYNSSDFAEWLQKFYTNGVFDGDLQVTAYTGMKVNVASGYSCINGRVKFFGTTQQITLPVAGSVYPRIDSIVIRLDLTNREITCGVVQGEYSGNTPAPSEPTRTGAIYELVIAQIAVGAGVTEINQSDITDTRADDDLCGWVASTVKQLSVQQLLAQAQAKFDEWFETIRDKLDGDTAGHLQNEIDNIADQMEALDVETIYTVLASGWSSTTTTLSGGDYYTYEIALNHVYNIHPIVGISTSNTVPTSAEQKAYDTFKYAIVDNTAMKLTLYSPKQISTDFMIVVKGVD